MRVAFVAAVLFASVLLAGPSQAPPAAAQAPADFDSTWSRDALWDDGQAEVALYDAKRPQYGKVESYEAVFIVVKEDFDAKLLVKADPPYEGRRLVPVLKLNAVHSYWTPNYPYHFLASVFVRRDDPGALVKLTVGSQEWCGNTFKLVKTAPRPELTVHSYFDPEGDATRPLDLRPGDLLEDQLPLALRGLAFAPGVEVRRRILSSLISNKLGREPQFLDATITVVGEENLATPAGRFASWKVGVKFGEVQQTWWFEKAAPHTLVKMESPDGRAWLLKSRTRKPYWQAATYRPAM
ncbi:MAG: hypothetical protein ACRD4T_09165 [Candidatus Acidiferrales bacterium]